jgi:hypothetical protein
MRQCLVMVGQVLCHSTDEHDYINTVVAAPVESIRLVVEDITCPSLSWHGSPRASLPRDRRRGRRAPRLGRAAPATQGPGPPARVPGESSHFLVTRAGRLGRHTSCNIVCCCKVYILLICWCYYVPMYQNNFLCCIRYCRCFITLSIEFVIVRIKMVVHIGCCTKHLHLLRLNFFVFLQLDANSYTIVVYVAKCKSWCCNTLPDENGCPSASMVVEKIVLNTILLDPSAS